MCRVSQVSCHAESGSAGQHGGESEMAVWRGSFMGRSRTQYSLGSFLVHATRRSYSIPRTDGCKAPAIVTNRSAVPATTKVPTMLHCSARPAIARDKGTSPREKNI